MKISSIANGRIWFEGDKYNTVEAYADKYSVRSSKFGDWPILDTIVAQEENVTLSEARKIWRRALDVATEQYAVANTLWDLFDGAISLAEAAHDLAVEPHELEAFLGRPLSEFSAYESDAVAADWMKE